MSAGHARGHAEAPQMGALGHIDADPLTLRQPGAPEPEAPVVDETVVTDPAVAPEVVEPTPVVADDEGLGDQPAANAHRGAASAAPATSRPSPVPVQPVPARPNPTTAPAQSTPADPAQPATGARPAPQAQPAETGRRGRRGHASVEPIVAAANLEEADEPPSEKVRDALIALHELSEEVAKAKARTEKNVNLVRNSRGRRGRHLKTLEAAQDRLQEELDAILDSADFENDPDESLDLVARLQDEIATRQLEHHHGNKDFSTVWDWVGNLRIGKLQVGKWVRRAAVVTAPLIVAYHELPPLGKIAANVSTFGAAALFGALRGAATGLVSGLTTSKLDRRLDNSKVRANARNRNGEGFASAASLAYEDGDDAKSFAAGLREKLYEQAFGYRSANESARRKRVLWSVGIGAVAGAVGGWVRHFWHAPDVPGAPKTGTVGPDGSNGGALNPDNPAFGGETGGDVGAGTPDVPELPTPTITQEAIDQALSQYASGNTAGLDQIAHAYGIHPEQWAQLANEAGESDNGEYLWRLLQNVGEQHYSDSNVWHTILDQSAELQKHGVDVALGGQAHDLTPTGDTWWVDHMNMPNGGLYIVDSHGDIHTFSGSLNTAQQSALLDLMRNNAEVYNQDEFAKYLFDQYGDKIAAGGGDMSDLHFTTQAALTEYLQQHQGTGAASPEAQLDANYDPAHMPEAGTAAQHAEVQALIDSYQNSINAMGAQLSPAILEEAKSSTLANLLQQNGAKIDAYPDELQYWLVRRLADISGASQTEVADELATQGA